MREIAIFVEDFAHQKVIGALVQRLADSGNMTVRLIWHNARRGHGAVVREFKEFLRDLERQGGPYPDMIIVGTDANCKGLNERAKDFQETTARMPVTLAIPDPHVERWLLLDAAAFKAVLGKGCDAPDQKCSRDRYKQRLIEAIMSAGVMPSLGGIEFAEDIVYQMDIERVGQMDRSFKRFVEAFKDNSKSF